MAAAGAGSGRSKGMLRRSDAVEVTTPVEDCDTLDNKVLKSMCAMKIKDSKLQYLQSLIQDRMLLNAKTDQLIPVKSLWQSEQDNMVIVFIRRFGCFISQERMRNLSSIKGLLDKHNVGVVAIGFEEEGVQAFMETIWSGELYIDSDRQCYKDLGMLRYASVSDTLGGVVYSTVLFPHLAKSLEEYLSSSICFKGDGSQLGGLAIVKEGQLVQLHLELLPGAVPDYDVILKTFNIKRNQPPSGPYSQQLIERINRKSNLSVVGHIDLSTRLNLLQSSTDEVVSNVKIPLGPQHKQAHCESSGDNLLLSFILVNPRDHQVPADTSSSSADSDEDSPLVLLSPEEGPRVVHPAITLTTTPSFIDSSTAADDDDEEEPSKLMVPDPMY